MKLLSRDGNKITFELSDKEVEIVDTLSDLQKLENGEDFLDDVITPAVGSLIEAFSHVSDAALGEGVDHFHRKLHLECIKGGKK